MFVPAHLEHTILASVKNGTSATTEGDYITPQHTQRYKMSAQEVLN